MKVTYKWTSRGPVMNVVLFHCVSSVANNFQMQQWLQLNYKRHFTTNQSYENKSAVFIKAVGTSGETEYSHYE